MGRAPCCDKMGVKRGAWNSKEDRTLIDFIHRNGHGNWRALPNQAGLLRCGKSCRLRWKNYLRPDIKLGNFSPEEEETIINLHELLGNKWSAIAARLPGRTDNEIKNVWNTHLKKRVMRMGSDPGTLTAAPHSTSSSSPSLVSLHNSEYNDASLIASPSTDKDTLEATVALPFPTPPKTSPDCSNTRVFNLSDSFYDSANLSSEIFSSMSSLDSETVSADSGCINSFEVDVGNDQQPQSIEDETRQHGLLLDVTFVLENQNIEGEESWLPREKQEEQSSSTKAHCFMSAYQEYDFLSSMDVVDGTNLHIPDFEDNDEDTDYWLNVLREAGSSPAL